MPAPRKYTDLQKQMAYKLYHKGDKKSRDKLISDVATWIVISCNSPLPYEFHAKVIIDLVHKRNRNGDLSLKEIAQITGVPAYYVCAIGKGYR